MPPSDAGRPGPPSSLFETVPEPTMLPATRSRVFARCAISLPNENVMSTPAFGRPNGVPFRCTTSGRWTLPSCHARPSSSGVTATGEKPDAGFDCRKPKPFASSAGIRLRRLTSLTSITRRTCASAAASSVPIGTSPVTTATSPSKSIPQASSASTMSSRAPSMWSEAPWYISGSVQNSGGIVAPRALRTSSTWLT